jgi:hypothetical protein
LLFFFGFSLPLGIVAFLFGGAYRAG